MGRNRFSLALLLVSLLLGSAPLAAAEVWQDFKAYIRQPAGWQQEQWLTLGGVVLFSGYASQYDQSVHDYLATQQTEQGDRLALVGNSWGELHGLAGLTLLSLYRW